MAQGSRLGLRRYQYHKAVRLLFRLLVLQCTIERTMFLERAVDAEWRSQAVPVACARCTRNPRLRRVWPAGGWLGWAEYC